MSSGIDVRQATAAFAELAPTLAEDELEVRTADARFSDGEVLDRALRHSLARLRYHLNRETFEYLRWKVQVARGQADALRAAGAARRAQVAPPGPDRAPPRSVPRVGRTTGDMRVAVAAHDWARSPVGASSGWPSSLRTAVQLALDSGFPHAVLWGPDLIQIYNDGYRDLMGARRPGALGRPIAASWPEMWQVGAPIFARALAGETVALEDAIFPLVCDGVVEERYFTLSCSPVIDDAGGVGGVMLMLFETTTQVEARGEVLEREHLVALLDQERARFADLTHELRTPLNAIGGYVQIMEMGLRGPITPEQRHDLLAIKQSQLHLMGLINSVLDFARVQSGKLQYSIERVVLDETFLAVEAMVAPLIRAKGVSYLRDRERDTDLAVLADREKLRQILVNLIGNAIKYTAEGGSVSVRVEPRGETLAIVVADTGVGIPAARLGAVFEPFVRLLDPRVTPAEGVGLGLAISRDLARAMGGELSASSVEGDGTAMTLTLPTA